MGKTMGRSHFDGFNAQLKRFSENRLQLSESFDDLDQIVLRQIEVSAKGGLYAGVELSPYTQSLMGFARREAFEGAVLEAAEPVCAQA